jgi:hypothetical protein
MSADALADVSGFFHEEEECVRAIGAIGDAGFPDPRVFSPFPSVHVLDALGMRSSPVRLWVLAGAIAGATSGFALTVGLSASWYPHLTAGMPFISVPPFVVIAFEMTVLFASLAGTAGFLFHGRFPQIDAMPGYHPRVTDDRFGVVIRCPVERASEAEAVLRRAGAEEVGRVPV